MKDDWKDFLSFNKAERRGIFVLSIIIALLLIYKFIGPFNSEEAIDFSKFEQQVEIYKNAQDSLKTKKTSSNYSKNNKRKIGIKSSHLSNFDPNATSKKEWLEMGLSEKQAKSILKYVTKGGKFYSPDDLRKLYCLSAQECELLIPYVLIFESMDDENGNEFSTQASWEKDTIIMELNGATMDNLMEINGIGPATAKGIIKYKEILGGYFSIEQLREVYHIDSSRYSQIYIHFTINTDSLVRINIDSADYYELKRHPYINKSLAYEIVQYRTMKGNYKSIDELKNVKGMSDSLYQKIYPYFALSKK